MFYDIYLYTLCYYICCLLGACMRCTWLCSLKPGVTKCLDFDDINPSDELSEWYMLLGLIWMAPGRSCLAQESIPGVRF
jgi:hypothetical protein